MSTVAKGVGGWVETHPYLADLARLQEGVDSAGIVAETLRDPRTAGEIARGIPVLRAASLDPSLFVAAGKLIAAMAEALLDEALPPALHHECRTLCVLLAENPEAGTRLARSLLAAGSDAPAGLGTFLAWKALARLAGSSERSEGWNASRCPTCGAPPAMAWLRQTDRGRERVLACGLCATRWSYARIGCPFCGNDDVGRLGVLEPEGEEAFRIDLCRQCNSYLKTYVGEGEEALALSDWSTLHLDAACAGRGLRRAGPSLYDL